MNNIKLSNNLTISQLNYGEYLVEKSECVNATIQAINTSYTHIDTAQIYQNKAEIGKAIQQAKY